MCVYATHVYYCAYSLLTVCMFDDVYADVRMLPMDMYIYMCPRAYASKYTRTYVSIGAVMRESTSKLIIQSCIIRKHTNSYMVICMNEYIRICPHIYHDVLLPHLTTKGSVVFPLWCAHSTQPQSSNLAGTSHKPCIFAPWDYKTAPQFPTYTVSIKLYEDTHVARDFRSSHIIRG